jgi:2-alkyl-3-oxoalkanoate reductase
MQMNVFVTGATGILGRVVVNQLLQTGHTIRALSRSENNDEIIKKLGAEPVHVDLDNANKLERALTGMDAVLHLASKIPSLAKIGKRSAWLETDFLRRDGTRFLVDAALKTSVRVFIYPSVVFVYPDGGSNWLEANQTSPKPAEYLSTTLDAEREVTRFAAKPETRAVNLRMGGFYSPESVQTLEMLRYVQAGVAPSFGHDQAYQPTIWLDDAASAVLAAMNSAPSGTYDVVDDEPLTRAEHRAVLARVAGRSKLWRIPEWLAPLFLGVTTETIRRSQRVSNARFKAVTNWQPTIKNARDGWANISSRLEPMHHQVPSPWALAGISYLALTGFLVGFWAQFAPRSFYDAFPGGGFAWVSLDGPFNEHLVRDVGGLNLALALFAVISLGKPRVWASVFGLVSLVYQLPHVIYHVWHINSIPTTLEQILQTLTLTLAVLIAAGLFWFGGMKDQIPNRENTRRTKP